MKEQKIPPLFVNIEWLGDELRVNVFHRREDKTSLLVHSSTHDVIQAEKSRIAALELSDGEIYSRMSKAPEKRLNICNQMTDEDAKEILKNFSLDVGDWSKNGLSVIREVENHHGITPSQVQEVML